MLNISGFADPVKNKFTLSTKQLLKLSYCVIFCLLNTIVDLVGNDTYHDASFDPEVGLLIQPHLHSGSLKSGCQSYITIF